MESVGSVLSLGTLDVLVTNHSDGHSPETWAELATNKIINIGDQSDPVLRAQAHAYKDQIQRVVAHYIRQAVAAEKLKLSSKIGG